MLCKLHYNLFSQSEFGPPVDSSVHFKSTRTTKAVLFCSYLVVFCLKEHITSFAMCKDLVCECSRLSSLFAARECSQGRLSCEKSLAAKSDEKRIHSQAHTDFSFKATVCSLRIILKLPNYTWYLTDRKWVLSEQKCVWPDNARRSLSSFRHARRNVIYKAKRK